MTIRFFIATNEVDIFHWGSYDDETQEFTTTQPIVNYYDTEEEMTAVLDQLGVEWRQPEPELPEPPELEPPSEPEPPDLDLP